MRRWVCMALWAAAGFLLALCIAGRCVEQPVRASSDCPVVSSVPDGKGGATVTFNCGAYIVTVSEPVWP